MYVIGYTTWIRRSFSRDQQIRNLLGFSITRYLHPENDSKREFHAVSVTQGINHSYSSVKFSNIKGSGTLTMLKCPRDI